MQPRAQRAAALFEEKSEARPHLNKLSAGLRIIRQQREFIGDAIHLIQTHFILKIIFISRIKAAVDFAVRDKMLKRRSRNQNNHQDKIKEISLLFIAAHLWRLMIVSISAGWKGQLQSKPKRLCNRRDVASRRER